MFKRYLILSVCLSFFISTKSIAEEIKYMADNQTTLVKIAAKDITRIFVEHDRIQSVKGQDHAYTIKNDAATGQIFIQPTLPYQNRAFSLFITTEQNRNYTLFAVPIDVPAQTIEIKPTSPSLSEATHWEQTAPYNQRIIELVRAMSDHQAPEGYVIHPSTQTVSTLQKNKLRLQLKASYLGAHLRGDVFSVKNISPAPLLLHADTFYHTHVRALALPIQPLLPNATLLLYQVSDND